jgi:hypothetical protein
VGSDRGDPDGHHGGEGDDESGDDPAGEDLPGSQRRGGQVVRPASLAVAGEPRGGGRQGRPHGPESGHGHHDLLGCGQTEGSVRPGRAAAEDGREQQVEADRRDNSEKQVPAVTQGAGEFQAQVAADR